MPGPASGEGMVTIRAEGMREFLAAMKKTDAEAPKAIKAGFNVAAEVVAAEARRRAPVYSGPAGKLTKKGTPVRAGALRDSIRVASTQKAAQIREGSRSVLYAGFIDYGNKRRHGRGVGRRDSNPRPFIPTGRIMYPAFEAKRAEVAELVGDALFSVAKRYGLDVTVHPVGGK